MVLMIMIIISKASLCVLHLNTNILCMIKLMGTNNINRLNEHKSGLTRAK